LRLCPGYIRDKGESVQAEIVTEAVSKSTNCIFAMRKDGQLVFGNRLFYELQGWDQKENIATHSIFELNNPWFNGKRWYDIIEQVSNKQVINFILNKPTDEQGAMQTFDCTSYLLQDSTHTDLIWTFGKEITERIHYEQQAKELNQIMSTVLNNIPIFISVKDVSNDLRYIFSNKNGGDFRSGMTSQIIGKTDYELYPLEQAAAIRAEDIKVLKNEGESRRIIEDQDQQGNPQIIDQLRIYIKDDFRPLLITIEQDITKTKLLENELIVAKERAIESDKLKSAFIANMSHEIRTPLNAIVGFSKIIAETENAEERASYYKIVESNNERLLGLINEILDLSKIESGIMTFESTPVKLKDFAEDIIHTMSIKCAEGVKLIYESPDDDQVIMCDRNRLYQVLFNLISNAAKFTTKGSITFGFQKSDNSIEFYVKDTGKGIPPDKLDKIFDRFVKADNFYPRNRTGPFDMPFHY
jgi:signal transduction histidine kinase